ncbi:MAG TPA: phosphatidate cytidylyltransferase [Chitinophagaceae bacterium]|nr:phosphatidate cytidylyltransferase [Chitinophagaceae bacterium]
MALNLQTLKTRSLTAVVFVVVMLGGLLINQWTLFALFSLVHFGAWNEYQKIVAKIDPDYAGIHELHKYGVMLAGWGLMLWFMNENYQLTETIYLHEIGWWFCLLMVVVLPLVEILFNKKLQLKLIAHSFFGLIYLSLSLALLMNLVGRKYTIQEPGMDYFAFFPLFIIGCMWVNDTMAYFVGSMIGKTPLSPISPKKTWEGTIGGVVLTGGIAYLVISLLLHWQTHQLTMASLAIVAAIVGTLGDLLESKLKRLANIKDSGSIMPGHGGFLDRFDSLLLAAPAIWLVVYWLF